MPATVPWTPLLSEHPRPEMAGQLVRLLLLTAPVWRGALQLGDRYGVDRERAVARLVQQALDIGDHDLAGLIILADDLGLLAEESH